MLVASAVDTVRYFARIVKVPINTEIWSNDIEHMFPSISYQDVIPVIKKYINMFHKEILEF